MMLLLLFFVGAAFALPPGKIVGGHDTDITEVPYQVSLEENDVLFWSHICGGSIVSESAVVTAAHCVGSAPGRIRFRAGSSEKGEGGSLHHASEILVHPNYDYENSDYDIAVVRVKEPFEVSDSVQPVALARVEPQAGEDATVSGWGTKNEGGLFLPKELQSVVVPIVERSICEEEYNNDDDPYDVTQRMICAGLPEGGKDSCQGDSGGPLVVNGTLAGVVSWGFGCARPGFAGVYTNVAELADWVDKQLQSS